MPVVLDVYGALRRDNKFIAQLTPGREGLGWDYAMWTMVIELLAYLLRHTCLPSSFQVIVALNGIVVSFRFSPLQRLFIRLVWNLGGVAGL